MPTTKEVLEDILEKMHRLSERSLLMAKKKFIAKEEKKLEKEMAKAFIAQGKSFLTKFQKEMKPLFEAHNRIWYAPAVIVNGTTFLESWTEEDWLEIFGEAAEDTMPDFVIPIEQAVTRSLFQGATSLIKQIGVQINFSLTNPRAEDYIAEHGAKLVTGINETTIGNIRTIMLQAAEEGWSYNTTAKELTDLYSGFAVGKPQLHIDSRAHLIAVTEVGNAYEAGNAIVGQELLDAGLQMEKSWLTSNDDRVSEGCQENQADGWIPFEDEHTSGDMNPLRFPGCRCTELYRRARG